MSNQSDLQLRVPVLICEGPCNPLRSGADNLVQVWHVDRSPEIRDQMIQAQRLLAYTPHRRVYGSLVRCTVCAHERLWGEA